MSTDLNQDTSLPTFGGIQALRGLAACMVVVHHGTQIWSQSHVFHGGVPPFWANGASGVDIFFVISGLVMVLSTVGKERETHTHTHTHNPILPASS